MKEVQLIEKERASRRKETILTCQIEVHSRDRPYLPVPVCPSFSLSPLLSLPFSDRH